MIVEEMRRGAHPKDAGMAALRRIKSNTIEKRLLNKRGEPNFNISFYVLNKKGEHAGVAMYGGKIDDLCVLRRKRSEDGCDGAAASGGSGVKLPVSSPGCQFPVPVVDSGNARLTANPRFGRT